VRKHQLLVCSRNGSKIKIPCKTQQLHAKIYLTTPVVTPQSADCNGWKVQSYLRLPLSDLLDNCSHCLRAAWPVAQKNAPLTFKTFFPLPLCYLRYPSTSFIITINDISSTPESSVLYCWWWMV